MGAWRDSLSGFTGFSGGRLWGGVQDEDSSRVEIDCGWLVEIQCVCIRCCVFGCRRLRPKLEINSKTGFPSVTFWSYFAVTL